MTKNPLILRFYRLVDAFTKSNEERDFYLNKVEGFILYEDLSRDQKDLDRFREIIENNLEDYCLIPKLTSYDLKKIMEGFASERVYDMDNKERLMNIISSFDTREKYFWQFINDNFNEKERWQQYYQEKIRAMIISWLRKNDLYFVLEEDLLAMSPSLIEKIKENMFSKKPPKDVLNGLEKLREKAETYYSHEALNPRPKRGRPPKNTDKTENEPIVCSADLYHTLPAGLRVFLYAPAKTDLFAFDGDEEEDSKAINIAEDNDDELDALLSRVEALKKRTS